MVGCGGLWVEKLTWLARGGVVACAGPYFALEPHWLQPGGTRDPLDKLRAIETRPRRGRGIHLFFPCFRVLRWHGPSLVPQGNQVLALASGLGGLWEGTSLPAPPSLPATCKHGNNVPTGLGRRLLLLMLRRGCAP